MNGPVNGPGPHGAHEAVLFDFYGTLVPRPAPELRTHRRTVLAGLLDCEPGAFTRAFAECRDARLRGTAGGTPEVLRAVVAAAGGTVREGALLTAVARVHAWTLRDAALSPACHALLTALRGRGFRLGVVSDCERDLAEVLPGTALDGLVDAVTLSCVTGVRKPARSQYADCARRLGVALERCVFVGDGGSDELRGAEEAGATAVHLATDDHNPFAAAGSWPGPTALSLTGLDVLVGSPLASRSGRDLHGSPD